MLPRYEETTREALLEFAENARLSKELVTIRDEFTCRFGAGVDEAARA
jgi:hypothetical protein